MTVNAKTVSLGVILIIAVCGVAMLIISSSTEEALNNEPLLTSTESTHFVPEEILEDMDADGTFDAIVTDICAEDPRSTLCE